MSPELDRPKTGAHTYGKRATLILAVAFALAALSYLWFGDTFLRQMRYMRMAKAHLPAIEKVVRQHQEFQDVRIGVGTAEGGCVMVVGRVRTEADLQKLKQVVAATKPPVEVIYVTLVGTERHFVRSDDFDEYQGLYVYALAPDGKLYLIHYAEKSGGKPISRKHVGQWEEDDGTLSWKRHDAGGPTTYVRNAKGVYVEKGGKYYVAVELMPVHLKNGVPLVK